MGIPFYFREIVQRNSNILLNGIRTCNRLFLDYNSIIHCCSAAVVTTHPCDYTHTQIFEEVLRYTLSIVDVCKPKDMLYIAVDGVAPRAKIQQQRKRRYMSAYKNNVTNEFKKANNIPVTSWDSNCITPGTEFMKELDAYLKQYFSQAKSSYTTIVSGHEEEGEGEHKIIRYIKEVSKGSESDVIYGLDADLIMLALSCEKSNIYLMRESNDFAKSVSNQNISSVTKQLFFKYMNIDAMRRCVAQHLYGSEDIAYMYDYIFICFMLGNDFLPNISFLKIRNGAIDVLCDAYKKVYLECGEHIVQRSKDMFVLNIVFLTRFFELLAKVEDEGMKEAIEQYENVQYNHHKRFNTKLERFVYELENFPLINKSSDTISPHTDSKWRIQYYHNLFGTFDSNIIKNASLNYIEGLVWTTNYYFNFVHDKGWCYRYEYSPCVTDIYKYIFTIDNEKLKTTLIALQQTNGPTITPEIQMVMVLPPFSKHLVPKTHQRLYSDIQLGCVHYFPSMYNFACFLKTQLWECAPILPHIDTQTVHTAMLKL
jgi:5'-3' exonuclease